MAMRWYVVHAYSGFEKSVQKALRERIERDGMQEHFGQILVPVEEVVDIKNGKRSLTERKFFPGYVLVQMEMNDETWHLVKSTPKVTGFVGGTPNRPAPISPKEVEAILQQIQEGVEKPHLKCCLKWVKKFVLLMDLSLISMARLMKLTTNVIACVCPCKFLAVIPLSN